jgi:hypothetical protein
MGLYSSMSMAAGRPGGVLYATTGSGRKNTMFFTAQFREGTYSPLPYKELEDKSELINNFVDSRKISRKELSLSGVAGTYWLGFYDPVDQKYLIYKF